MRTPLNIIIILGVIIFGTSCSANKNAASGNTEQSSAASTKLAQGHDQHGDQGSVREDTIAKLTANKVQANTDQKLIIDIKSKNGQIIEKFETFQTKLMHLIIVSDDLQTFKHIHPNYKQKGRFEVQANFPYGGNYMLISDYKPTGQAEQVSLMPLKVSGKEATASKVDFIKTKLIGDTNVQLVTNNIKAGQVVALVFKLQQANGQAVSDLQPYLGQRGHLVIIKQSALLTSADYIHAHADAKTIGAEEVKFMATFPEPGKYKLWGQFNRGGKVITADFWVNVI